MVEGSGHGENLPTDSVLECGGRLSVALRLIAFKFDIDLAEINRPFIRALMRQPHYDWLYLMIN
jgi:hypothetical protein